MQLCVCDASAPSLTICLCKRASRVPASRVFIPPDLFFQVPAGNADIQMAPAGCALVSIVWAICLTHTKEGPSSTHRCPPVPQAA
eukprot:1161186-Pelagomonas_calceolata.AAC.12